MDEKMDYQALFGVLRRQGRLMLATVFLTMVVAALYAYSRAPVYTAGTLLQIEPQSPDLLAANTVTQNFGINDIRVDGEIEIIRSEAVAQRVVLAAGLIADPEFGAEGLSGTQALNKTIGNFQQALRVGRRRQTYLVQIEIQAQLPAQAAALSTLTAQTYIDNRIEARVSALQGVADILRARLSAAQAGLLRSESAMDGFIGDNLALISARPGAGNITSLAARVGELRAQAAQVEGEMRNLDTALAAQDWAAVAGSLDLQSELAAVDAELAAQQRLAGLQGNAAGLRAELGAAQGQLRKVALGGEMPPELLTRLYALQQEARISRGQYDDFLSRLRAVEVQADLQVAGARIVSPALVPLEPSGQTRRMFLALAAGLALVLAAGAAYLREYMIGGFTSAAQLAGGLRLPVLAALPEAERLAGAGEATTAQLMVAHPMGAFAESVRRLRMGVARALPATKTGQVIMLGSALPGEGKSDTCLALGRVYAASGKRCLLIDCDLRKPRIARITGLKSAPDRREFLLSDAALTDMVQTDPVSTLDILPGAGPADMPTDDLLSGPRFATLLEQARSAYDVVLLDTPPLHAVVDAHYLASQVDAIVLAVKWASTAQRDLRAALPALLAAKKPETPVFLVLTRIKVRGHIYGRKYTGYYH